MAKTFSEKELARIDEARQDRANIQDRLNSFYSLGIPHRQYVGESTFGSRGNNEDEQDEIFDSTLQEAVADFASDQLDFFMPDYKQWVKLKPGTRLKNSSSEKAFAEQSKKWEETLYDLIRNTNWYEQNLEVFHDLAGGAAGTIIPFAPLGSEVKIKPVLMHGLIMEDGAFNDLDGRWDEFHTKKRHLRQLFGEEVYKSLDAATKQSSGNSNVKCIQGCRREYDNKGSVRWRWIVAIGKKVVSSKLLPAGTPPPMNVCRWRHAPPSAWGPGPADAAMTSARTLDQLAYLHLRKLGKEVDPPMSFVADGVFNPDAGVENGTFVARRMGSEAPTPMYEPQSSREVFFERDALRWSVKKALYQDKPEQSGKTPPTASQWMDEKTSHERRQQARRRVYREYVLPSLRRFAYVFAARGELDPILIDGETVMTEFVSPLSKASDVNEVSSAIQLAQSFVGTFSEAALGSIDAYASMENMQKGVGDTMLVLKEPDQQADLIQQTLTGGKNIV